MGASSPPSVVATYNQLVARHSGPELDAAGLADALKLPGMTGMRLSLARRMLERGAVEEMAQLREVSGIGAARLTHIVAALEEARASAPPPALEPPAPPAEDATADEAQRGAVPAEGAPHRDAAPADAAQRDAPEPRALQLPSLSAEALAALTEAAPEARAAVSAVLPAVLPMIERSATSGMLPLPGLDVVGRGVYLRPHAPYELKRHLFEQRRFRPKFSPETGQVFAVPEGYGVNEAPPLPEGVALNQISVESSWERFAQRRSLDVSAAAGAGPFSISATAGHSASLRSEESSFYATRSSFLAMWSVYLEDPTTPSRAPDTSSLPVPFAPRHRAAYERFFQRHGSHVIKRAWVGGRAELVFSVARASGLSSSDIQAGLSGGALGGSASSSGSQSREALLSNSRCTVLGRGGNEGALAALSSLDEAAYNEWIRTIRENPQTIELEVCGVWSVVEDPAAARALQLAYLASSTFTPISAVFRVEDRVTFTRGREYFTYDLDTHEVSRPRPLVERWPELDALGFDVIDAAYVGGPPGRPLGLYLFRQDKVIRVDLESDALEPPVPTSEAFPGVDFERVDAAISADSEHLYLFSGANYSRFCIAPWRADEGYPDSLQARWQGVSFDRVDAAFYRGDGKVFFLRGDQLVRYDMVNMRADPGYPKTLVGDYVEDWRFFE